MSCSRPRVIVGECGEVPFSEGTEPFLSASRFSERIPKGVHLGMQLLALVEVGSVGLYGYAMRKRRLQLR
jgi:hypothetical protein